MRRKHPTDAQTASYFFCHKCHEPFRTKAYCRDHQRLCTKTGDLIVCAVCGLAFHVAHHWTQHKAQTGHRGHTMRAPDGAVVACGDDATATAVTLDDGVRFGLVRRLRCGEPPPLLFAEVVCAYRMTEEQLELQELGREQVARAAPEGQEEEEEERVGWQRTHGSGAGGPSGDDDEEEEEWDDSDEELYDATPDGPLRLPIVAGSPGWLQPGGAERQPENQQVLMERLMERDQAGLGEAVQVTAEELADEHVGRPTAYNLYYITALHRSSSSGHRSALSLALTRTRKCNRNRLRSTASKSYALLIAHNSSGPDDHGAGAPPALAR
eukprot:scaffold8019_cov133-Isochrysis_galbana.AAC.2